ncbi:hypothetical protein PIB30_115975, partial [Stylosanthes scabra]|nr:hypothetical protein [Stylosanthes scabra]
MPMRMNLHSRIYAVMRRKNLRPRKPDSCMAQTESDATQYPGPLWQDSRHHPLPEPFVWLLR